MHFCYVFKSCEKNFRGGGGFQLGDPALNTAFTYVNLIKTDTMVSNYLILNYVVRFFNCLGQSSCITFHRIQLLVYYQGRSPSILLGGGVHEGSTFGELKDIGYIILFSFPNYGGGAKAPHPTTQLPTTNNSLQYQHSYTRSFLLPNIIFTYS